MISFLSGEVKDISAATACILTPSGLGYDVEMPLPALYQLTLGEHRSFWTHLVVREDAQILCAFLDKHERDTFKILLKIPGIGLKMALAMLSSISPAELATIVEQGDDVRLSKIPGIGKKTAQRLLLELKGKLASFTIPAADSFTTTNNMLALTQAQQALMALGYKEKEAQYASGIAQADGAESVEALIKAALKVLGGF